MPKASWRPRSACEFAASCVSQHTTLLASSSFANVQLQYADSSCVIACSSQTLLCSTGFYLSFRSLYARLGSAGLFQSASNPAASRQISVKGYCTSEAAAQSRTSMAFHASARAPCCAQNCRKCTRGCAGTPVHCPARQPFARHPRLRTMPQKRRGLFKKQCCCTHSCRAHQDCCHSCQQCGSACTPSREVPVCAPCAPGCSCLRTTLLLHPILAGAVACLGGQGTNC